MKTKTEIIEETAAFYNLSNRGYDKESNSCRYLTGDGKMCAVGRCLINPEEQQFNEEGAHTLLSCSFDLLKKEYRIEDLDFWYNLQRFHDCRSNWTDSGLSSDGELEKRRLLNQFKD